MNFKVTGKNGFIGKHVCQFIKDIGGNITEELCYGCTVVHLAAYGNHYFQTESDKIIKANIIDLKKLIDESLQNNVEKFYNISTSSITLPIQTMYSASKLFGETVINSLKDERFVNVRPYSVYGEGEAEHRFIPTVIRHLKSGEVMQLDPYATHDFIYVYDFINALFEGYKNIGTGISNTNLQIVQYLENISGKKLNYEKKKLRSYDNEKWVCQTSVPHMSIYEGLKKTYDAINNA